MRTYFALVGEPVKKPAAKTLSLSVVLKHATAFSGSYPSSQVTNFSLRPLTPPCSLTSLKSADTAWLMAGPRQPSLPVKGSPVPITISESVTPIFSPSAPSAAAKAAQLQAAEMMATVVAAMAATNFGKKPLPGLFPNCIDYPFQIKIIYGFRCFSGHLAAQYVARSSVERAMSALG